MSDLETGLMQHAALPRRRAPGRLDFALPTINIIFLLTLYFLLAGTLTSPDEIADDLPRTLQTATERLPRPLLTVVENGSFLVDGMTVDRSNLLPAATEALRQRPGSVLNVVVSGQSPAQPLFSLLGELTTAGIPVRIVTERAVADLPP